MDHSQVGTHQSADAEGSVNTTFAKFSSRLDGSDRRVLSPVEQDGTHAYFSTSHRPSDDPVTSPTAPAGGALKKVANTQAFLRRVQGRHRLSAVPGAQVCFDDEDEEEGGGLLSSKLMSRTQRKSVAINKTQSGLFFDDDDDNNDGAAADAAENNDTALPPAFEEMLLDKPSDADKPVVDLQPQQNNTAKKPTKKIKMFQRLFDDANPEKRLYLLPDEVLNAMRAFGANINEDALLLLLQEIDTSDSAKNYQFAGSIQKSKRSRSITDQAVQQLSSVVDQVNRFIVNPAKNMLLRSAGNHSNGGDENQDSINLVFQAPRVFFEDFVSLMELWQTSARFQIFEDRLLDTQERLEQVRDMKSFIPDGLMMWFWQCVMLIASFYLVVSAVGSYVNNDNEISSYLSMTTVTDGFVSVLLLIDLVVRMRTGIVPVPESEDLNDTTKSTFVDNPRTVFLNYITSAWFLLDLFCAVPFRFVVCVGGDSSFDVNITALERNTTLDNHEYFQWTGCAQSESLRDFRYHVFVARLLSLVRALKFLETFWYFPETSVTPMTRIYIWRQYVIAEFLSTVAQFGVAVHILAVIHHNIQDSPDLLSSSSFHRYSQSMYTVLYCLATVGYGDVIPKTDSQRFFMMFLCLLGMLFSGFVIGSIVSFLQSSDIEMDRQRKLVETSTLLEYFRVPTALREEVLSFQNYILEHSLMKSYDSVVEALPADMQQNLDLWTRIQAVHTFPLLQHIHRSAKLSICNALVEITFCPEEYIYLFGENGEEMFFINHGFVDLLDTRGLCTRTLKAGDYFGEGAVVERPGNCVPRLDDAKSITYCEVFVLNQQEFHSITQKYLKFSREVETFAAKQRIEFQNILASSTRSRALSRSRAAADNNNSQNHSSTLTGVDISIQQFIIAPSAAASDTGSHRQVTAFQRKSGRLTLGVDAPVDAGRSTGDRSKSPSQQAAAAGNSGSGTSGEIPVVPFSEANLLLVTPGSTHLPTPKSQRLSRDRSESIVHAKLRSNTLLSIASHDRASLSQGSHRNPSLTLVGSTPTLPPAGRRLSTKHSVAGFISFQPASFRFGNSNSRGSVLEQSVRGTANSTGKGAAAHHFDDLQEERLLRAEISRLPIGAVTDILITLLKDVASTDKLLGQLAVDSNQGFGFNNPSSTLGKNNEQQFDDSCEYEFDEEDEEEGTSWDRLM